MHIKLSPDGSLTKIRGNLPLISQGKNTDEYHQCVCSSISKYY